MASSCGQKRKREPGKRCVVMFCDKTNADGTMKHVIASTHDKGTADDLGADSTLSSDPGEQSAPESAMPILVNKATQKSLRIQKRERRSKDIQVSTDQVDIAVQCNIANLPPLGTIIADESDEENTSDGLYSPSLSDLEDTTPKAKSELVNQLVSNEVRNSSWMELEGLKRSVDLLTTADLTIDTLITDRSRSIGKYIKEELPDTTHYYDIWHVAKGLGKKFDKVEKQKDCGDIAEWKQSICNHMYWCAASTPDGPPCCRIKTSSLLSHLLFIYYNLHYPCTFRTYTQVTMYFTLNVAMENWKEKEGINYGWNKPVTRLYLSALHYNVNADRAQAVDKDGNPAYSITFPKAKKAQYSVRPQKTKVTYDYCTATINSLFEKYRRNPKELKAYMDTLKENTPPPLSATQERPDKDEAIESYDMPAGKLYIDHSRTSFYIHMPD
ncbi:hypothetical protein QZH41_019335 [Actinostola sp. cb2023]|nr:hypothetical protein QZH41_019335 [Actinostola sp. cb2023]